MLKRLIKHPLQFSAGIYALAVCLVLTGCQNLPVQKQAKILNSKYLVVDSQRVQAARCEITDEDNGMWSIAETPETLDVTNAKGLLSVTCYKSGFKPTSAQAAPNQGEITVWMEPSTWSSKQQKEVWQKAKEEYERKNH